MDAFGGEYPARLRDSFLCDELAQLAKRDAVEYLLDVLGPSRKIDLQQRGPLAQKYPLDTGRLRRVIELAAERSGWAKKKPTKGHALGIAAHRSFLSYVAVVVEIEADNNERFGFHA